ALVGHAPRRAAASARRSRRCPRAHLPTLGIRHRDVGAKWGRRAPAARRCPACCTASLRAHRSRRHRLVWSPARRTGRPAAGHPARRAGLDHGAAAGGTGSTGQLRHLMEFIAYRCAAWETPFWFDPNPEVSRYNRSGEAPTTYLGLHPLTPWAEYLRANNCHTEDEVLAARPRTWAVRVTLAPDEVVQLSFDQPDPLSAEELVDDDYSACQAFASGLRGDRDAPKAIIAPS